MLPFNVNSGVQSSVNINTETITSDIDVDIVGFTRCISFQKLGVLIFNLKNKIKKHIPVLYGIQNLNKKMETEVGQ